MILGLNLGLGFESKGDWDLILHVYDFEFRHADSVRFIEVSYPFFNFPSYVHSPTLDFISILLYDYVSITRYMDKCFV
mgnify:CR=1 FL=1